MSKLVAVVPFFSKKRERHFELSHQDRFSRTMSVDSKWRELIDPADPDELFELTEILASGAYGSVYKVSVSVFC